MASLPRFPLGVDAVEYRKAKAFLERHRRDLASFLGRTELAYVRRGAKPHVRLAEILAAKEAAFKAVSPRTRLGLDLFREIRIVPRRAKGTAHVARVRGFRPRVLRIAFVRRRAFAAAQAFAA